jgi:hypothetical protein
VSCRATAAKRWVAQERAKQESIFDSVVDVHLQTLLANRRERAADVATIVVSTSPASMEPLAASRREALRESIALAVAASAGGESHVAETELATADCAPPSAATFAACASCRGHCCRSGGDSAYIDASTVRRVRSQMPDLSSSELVALYMDAVPARSVERSCIYHGEHGCALARELRSDICNRYFCQPMREWLGRAAATAGQLTAVVVLDEGRVVRSTLIE